MTHGTVSALERRQSLLDEREDQILALLKEKTSLKAISMLVGMPLDHCKVTCYEIIKKHGLDYDSAEAAKAERDKMPVGITSDSDMVRHRLANLMYDARQRDHALTISMATGLSAKQQRLASERPYRHNWTLAELERFARYLDTPFPEFCRKVFG
ncbi:hypothetical protein KNJ79_05075 [Sphingopyxis indica]|uniref:hypothetical protein n=1 Tax=Sphingopyxis indica TaxID=436663 RepID=UPI0029395128|nr:hypothetical protein [Sphingopyxis indica]WOF44304.1 hypothetical protein KNJ79_05075 [Sphingopyxis indica]